MISGDHRGRLVDQVQARLLEWIVERSLKQGARLPSEHDICQLAGVSRGIVREALSRLQADGLVETRQGAGSFLRQRPAARQLQGLGRLEIRGLLDRFQVRIELEPAAARLAAAHHATRTPHVIAALLATLAAPSPATATDTGGLHLHRTIATASGNPMFCVALDALLLPASTPPALDSPGSEGGEERARHVTTEHIAVLQAVERGDGEGAEAAMRLHLLNARNRALGVS